MVQGSAHERGSWRARTQEGEEEGERRDGGPGKLKLRERGLSQPSKKSYKKSPQKSGFVSQRRVGRERNEKGAHVDACSCLVSTSLVEQSDDRSFDSPETGSWTRNFGP